MHFLSKRLVVKIFCGSTGVSKVILQQKITMLENEAWTKGWSDQKENSKSYEVYLSNYDWIEIWIKNHGKRTLNKLLPFIIFTIFVLLIVLNIKNQSNFKKRI